MLDLDCLAPLLAQLAGERAAPCPPDPHWRAQPAQCHANATRWAQTHQGYTPVRGWLRVTNETPPSRVRYVAHSLVENDRNELFEVTLPPDRAVYAFIRHPWDATTYLAAVADNKLPSFDHIVRDDDAAWTEALAAHGARGNEGDNPQF